MTTDDDIRARAAGVLDRGDRAPRRGGGGGPRPLPRCGAAASRAAGFGAERAQLRPLPGAPPSRPAPAPAPADGPRRLLARPPRGPCARLARRGRHGARRPCRSAAAAPAVRAPVLPRRDAARRQRRRLLRPGPPRPHRPHHGDARHRGRRRSGGRPRLADAGADTMRINCAHDSQAEWARMVANIRAAPSATPAAACRSSWTSPGPR